MNKELKAIRHELTEISEREATKLSRLARRMIQHGCRKESIDKCIDEVFELHMNAYPERLLNPFKHWEYAFKF